VFASWVALLATGDGENRNGEEFRDALPGNFAASIIGRMQRADEGPGLGHDGLGTRWAALGLVVVGCATTRGLHSRCATTNDCSAGAICMTYATEAGAGQTCELPCRTHADCPVPMWCGVATDGPRHACFPPMNFDGLMMRGPDGGLVPAPGERNFLPDGGLRDCSPQRIENDAGVFERASDGGDVPCRSAAVPQPGDDD
jgi:hypothetical protein